MVSIWWLLVAFLGGTYAGITLMALMHVSARLPEQINDVPNLDLEHMSS